MRLQARADMVARLDHARRCPDRMGGRASISGLLVYSLF